MPRSQAFVSPLPLLLPRPALPSFACPHCLRPRFIPPHASAEPPLDRSPRNEQPNPTISWLLSALIQRAFPSASAATRPASRNEPHKTSDAVVEASPTIASLLASLTPGPILTPKRDDGEDANGRGLRKVSDTETTREGTGTTVEWLLAALAWRRPPGEAMSAGGEKGEERPAVEEGERLNSDGSGMEDEGGVYSALSWLLAALKQRRRTEEERVVTKRGEGERAEGIRGEEECTGAQRAEMELSENTPGSAEQKPESPAKENMANGNESNSAVSWILGRFSEKVSSELPPGSVGDGAQASRDGALDSRLQEARAKEAENQLLSWLTSTLRPDATEEEVKNQTLSWLASKLGPNAEKLRSAIWQEIVERGSDAASELSRQAMKATLSALNVEPFDNLDFFDSSVLPRRPFDPVHALALAGYAFRAYLDPPSASYRETFAASVGGSKLSGLDQQLVYTDFVYPNTALISRRARGVFLLQVMDSEGLEGQFVTAEINGSLVLDLLRRRSCAVLCQHDTSSSRLSTFRDGGIDQLVLNVFSSEQAYDEGRPPTDFASFSLADLTEEGLENGVYIDGDVCTMKFKKVSEETKNEDFFHFSLLPSEMNLSFPFQYNTHNSKDNGVESVGSASISVRTSFVPIISDPQRRDIGEVSSMLANAEATSFRSMTSGDVEVSLESVLASELTPGQLPEPDDWTRLAGVVRSLYARVGSDIRFERTSTVTENIPGALFIESMATDTEVWLFHDEVNRDIVISFRGTEQVSWKDFFTDAQLFLQRWAPGEEIDLNVEVNRTVGLSEFVPGMLPSPVSSIPEDASAVHYGFLRAYMSIRDALQRGVEMLSSDLSEGYSFHFTGHSLGGALAIIASSDFQARHMFDNYEVSCVSYGAPKVGNVQFATIFNKLVPNSFRVVNDTDLVARMPRSLSGKSSLNRYQHAGRTVLINNDGDYWIEGYQRESLLLAKMSSIEDPFRERYKNLQDLMAFEQKLWTELISGRSVQHHMPDAKEDAYFIAMNRVLRKFVEGQRI